jgi:hypothetical protein
MTLQNPTVTDVGASSRGDASALTMTLTFTNSSMDYRDPAAKVGFFTPSGVIWDPEQHGQACKVFDPDDAVSRLPHQVH